MGKTDNINWPFYEVHRWKIELACLCEQKE